VQTHATNQSCSPTTFNTTFNTAAAAIRTSEHHQLNHHHQLVSRQHIVNAVVPPPQPQMMTMTKTECPTVYPTRTTTHDRRFTTGGTAPVLASPPLPHRLPHSHSHNPSHTHHLLQGTGGGLLLGGVRGGDTPHQLTHQLRPQAQDTFYLINDVTELGDPSMNCLDQSGLMENLRSIGSLVN